MAKVELLQGSWHNSGFHGHFRSKSRSDFICEYRHLAKPPPPKTFLRRAKENAAKHVFSNHDNRNSFMTDAQYFEQGLGRRRIQNSTNRYQRDLLMWLPDRVGFERGDPALSVYRLDYPIKPGSDNVKQRFVQRPKTSFDDEKSTMTSYRYSHGNANPNQTALNAMSNLGLTTTLNRKQRASFVSGRESVATCLSWYVPPKVRPVATQTIELPIASGTSGTGSTATGTTAGGTKATYTTAYGVTATGTTAGGTKASGTTAYGATAIGTANAGATTTGTAFASITTTGTTGTGITTAPHATTNDTTVSNAGTASGTQLCGTQGNKSSGCKHTIVQQVET